MRLKRAAAYAALTGALLGSAGVARAQAQTISRNLNSYVLFAVDELDFKGGNESTHTRGHVLGGNVGVNQDSNLGDNQSSLSVGANGLFKMSDNTQLVGGSIRLGPEASVWDVYVDKEVGTGWGVTNSVIGGPTIRNTKYPISNATDLPIIPWTELTTAQLCGPFAPVGTTDVTVTTGAGGNSPLTLAPGAYRDVQVQNGATIRLQAGVYTVRRFTTGQNVNVYTVPGTVIHVWGDGDPNAVDFNLGGNGSYFGSEAPGVESVACICVSDALNNSSGTANNNHVQFSDNGTFWGVINAPGSSINLGRNFTHYGRFVGETIGSDFNVNVTYRECTHAGALEVTKDASTSLTRTRTWSVSKDADATYDKFIGDPATSHGYTVSVGSAVVDGAWAVTGTILISNGTTQTATITGVSDVVSGGIAANVSCGVSFPHTLAPGTQLSCPYSAALPDASARTNNVTVSTSGAVSGGTASAPVSFENPTVTLAGPATVTVNDTNGQQWTTGAPASWSYGENFSCPTDKTVYTNGVHNFARTNTATIAETGQSDSALVTVRCYAPIVSKTANGTFDEVHDWQVYKSVNTASQNRFAGQSAGFTWTVRVDETTHGESYLVSGAITVRNPNPATAMTVSLTDALDDGTVVAIGPCTGGTFADPNLTLAAGATATCDYSATPKGDLADFASVLPAQVSMVVNYPAPESYFLATVSNGGALDGTYEGWCIDTDRTISPGTTYQANVFSSYEPLPAGLVEYPQNFDLVNWIINQDLVGKPATDGLAPDAGNNGYGESLGNYTYSDVQRAIWELVDDTLSTAGLGSWSQNRVNEIKAMAQANGEGFTPTCGDFIAVVLQPVGGQQPITIAQVTFASLNLSCAERNTVTAAFNGMEFPASADILWTPNPINPTVTLDDTQKPDWPTTVSADATFSYADPQGYTCSTDPAVYAGDGHYPYTETNTATLSTGAQATATTTVNCYGPLVSKTAVPSYTRTYGWSIGKTVTETSHTGLAGQSFTSNYAVTVTQTVQETDFLVVGVITVKNPRPDASMTVTLADVLANGSSATITSCSLAAGAAGSTVSLSGSTLTLSKSAAAACSYTGSSTKVGGVNTAKATLNGVVFVGTAPYAFGAPTTTVGSGSVTVSDTNGESWPASATSTWQYAETLACPTDRSLYTNGQHVFTHPNTAKIEETGQQAQASVQVTCYLPATARVVKTTTDGPEAIGDASFTFELFEPGTTAGGSYVETQTLSGPGQVVFSRTLDLSGTWRVVEVLPDGWANGTLQCSFSVAYPASAGKTYDCSFHNTEKSRVTLLKRTNGEVNPTKGWQFALYAGPDGFGSQALATGTTLNNTDGIIDFGALDLDPTQSYTLCETSVPAAWSSFWAIDTNGDATADVTLVAYNPNADDPTPQDVGNRCVDIGVAHAPAQANAVPLVPGATLSLLIDNNYPGGAARTPGYWKNWNRCTIGGQAANAARNGGHEAGFWLVEDVLDPAIGGGIVWDDILADNLTFAITQCAVAVDILDQRLVGDPAKVGDGKKVASDAAYTLAMHLLAAEMNQAAGAYSCNQLGQLIVDGEKLLDKLNFSGTASYLAKPNQPDYAAALALAKKLDQYNNNKVQVDQGFNCVFPTP